VPLTLVTGPANAEKAGFVLGAYRAALEEEPILVVPTFADVDTTGASWRGPARSSACASSPSRA